MGGVVSSLIPWTLQLLKRATSLVLVGAAVSLQASTPPLTDMLHSLGSLGTPVHTTINQSQSTVTDVEG